MQQFMYGKQIEEENYFVVFKLDFTTFDIHYSILIKTTGLYLTLLNCFVITFLLIVEGLWKIFILCAY